MNSVAQVAEQLKVSHQIVYALIEAGKLACYRIGLGRGTIRVSNEQLQLYLDAVRVDALKYRQGVKRNYLSSKRLKHLGD